MARLQGLAVPEEQMIESIANVIIGIVYGGPALFIILAFVNFFFPFHDYSTGKPILPKKHSSKEEPLGLQPLDSSQEYKVEDNFGF